MGIGNLIGYRFCTNMNGAFNGEFDHINHFVDKTTGYVQHKISK